MNQILLLLPLLLVGITLRSGEGGAEPVVAKNFEPITLKQEEAIKRGAKWLAAQQQRNGSWSPNQYTAAMTGLAGMALLSTGSTPNRGPYGSHVSRAVDWFLKNQDARGLYGGSNAGRGMYGHGFGTTFLAQAYGMGMDPDRAERVQKSLIKAGKLIAKSQSHNGGWFYSPDSNADEGSVTVTQAQALRVLANAGIPIPDKTIRNAVQYIYKSQNNDGTINYSAGRQGATGGTLALTAAGAMVFFSLGKYHTNDSRSAKTIEAAKRMFKKQGFRSHGHDVYTNFYAGQAFYLAGEPTFAEFFPRLRDRIMRAQATDGSWPGNYAGGVYGTSLNLMVLTIPYNYLPMYQR